MLNDISPHEYLNQLYYNLSFEILNMQKVLLVNAYLRKTKVL